MRLAKRPLDEYTSHMATYDHKKIEKKWQKRWQADGLYLTSDDRTKEKVYVLDMFPYPSGEGLHVGHPKGYIATDVYSRMKRMQGKNVLHPMGWDAFGLPAEQYALKNKVHPRTAVEKNVARFKEQLKKIGFNYDWGREISTTDPQFYRWTQWIFKQIFRAGLAYESHEPINWCPSCKTGLSNEDLEGGACERCGTPVEKKALRQWVIRITEYADRLLSDLELLPEWPESIKESQRNWIGRSEGAEITFALLNVPGQEDGKNSVTVFTTRPDTLFGATYVAISAELAKKWMDAGWKMAPAVSMFVEKTLKEETTREYGVIPEKEGIDTGIKARNPANGELIPVWVANYVLSGYGSGAIMAVPAHDERDWEFAQKYSLPIRKVIKPLQNITPTGCYTGGGMLINSGKFDDMASEEAKTAITEMVGGKMTTTYKLKDWVFARQRYWGEPFPIVFDENHNAYAVADTELPVLLPEVESYEPTGTGESPLANIRDWVEVWGRINAEGEFESLPTGDPRGKRFTRETNTMPQWAGSSWYYLRFMDPANTDAFVGKQAEAYWGPVDVYVGGAEHATRHLIYARFWHKFLFDKGFVSSREPFLRLHNVGLIQASDGRKMSKRYGNVVNPDDIVERFGADTLRVYEMFMGPFSQSIAWSTENMMGARRFIERVWRMAERVSDTHKPNPETRAQLHQTVKKVSEDIERFAFNTAISQMMILLNAFEKEGAISSSDWKTFLRLLAPFAPHITEELWDALGEKISIHIAEWPGYDAQLAMNSVRPVAVQVNGKLRATLSVDAQAAKEEVLAKARALPHVAKYLNGRMVKQEIYIPGRIINFVVS
jgi:leucyl-tRNA synthetase